MSEIKQQIFTRAYAEELRSRLSSGESLLEYFSHQIDVPDAGLLESTFQVSGAAPELDTDVSSDVDNAIKLYEYLNGLDKTQASDKRLWLFLSHVTFRDYTMGRWKITALPEDLNVSPEAKRKATSIILDRWFLTGNARSLRRHSISRLWWAAYLTVAPWEQDNEYFGSLETTDRYVYTKILFTTQDIVSQILERKLGWSDKLLIAILEFLRQNPEIAQNRDAVRATMKELNLVLGYRKLSVLNFNELLDVINETAQGIAIS